MHPNAALIERFYAAFAARDAAGMQACHYPDIVFSDPAFGGLRIQ
jgi:ketosteroid isomerase-like protein